jgi:hypothetical protein
MCRRKPGTVNGSRHSPTPGIEPWNPERYRGGPPFLPGRLTRSAARFGDAYAGANHMC